MSETEKPKEKMRLEHEAQPGYKTTFNIVVVIAFLYLLYIFIATMF